MCILRKDLGSICHNRFKFETGQAVLWCHVFVTAMLDIQNSSFPKSSRILSKHHVNLVACYFERHTRTEDRIRTHCLPTNVPKITRVTLSKDSDQFCRYSGPGSPRVLTKCSRSLRYNKITKQYNPEAFGTVSGEENLSKHRIRAKSLSSSPHPNCSSIWWEQSH